MELITHKIITMVLTGVIPLLFGLIPWKIGRRYCKPDNVRHQRIVSILLCYGGGILLGLSLLHLLPEVSLSARVLKYYFYLHLIWTYHLSRLESLTRVHLGKTMAVHFPNSSLLQASSLSTWLKRLFTNWQTRTCSTTIVSWKIIPQASMSTGKQSAHSFILKFVSAVGACNISTKVVWQTSTKDFQYIKVNPVIIISICL